MKKLARLRTGLRYLAAGSTTLLAALLLVVFVTGDFGATQYLLNRAEARALAHQSTRLDQLGLRALYQAMQLTSLIRYPRAAEYLRYYCSGQGDTLRFDAAPLLGNPQVQLALRQHKQAITFRHQPPTNPRHHVVRHTNLDLYYAFDLLFIKTKPGRVIFYDQYYFQPLARKSRTAFQVGNIRFKLNDGLIHVAYPRAKMFVTYGEARVGG
ncbi:hypothetical protein [Hymenobacter lucidus]|uniref:Uncharacterized protein n=1 Tax=Hymenobacter lucidus TaxID=2880930 RepID=A0ABS8AQY5_9BACT|nr:hypothetical protein [Hymenobacter lucidus]MCB2408637.1 hypothetical protein [Hymenobacter lucidus]